MDIKKLVGKTLSEAKKMCKEENIPCRVVSVDGEAMVITMDYSVQRINFVVVDGIVTETKRG
jgi:hypothetical protein